ncbi:hypothetical protein SAMN02910292_01559 [Lachnospiraceae bacterium XBB2008]|nr:hypothetical protein SAMN02910292_01559 [Lachnospiraceae bacterium XBB2008]
MDRVSEILRILYELITYSETGNDFVDVFVYHSSWIMELAGLVGLIVMIFRNPRLKKHERTEDRYLFYECIMVIVILILQLSLIPLVYSDSMIAYYAFVAALTVNEVLYMFIILQWLVFVDYSLYRSKDHIRRRYKHAAIPIIILAVIDILQSFLAFYTDALLYGWTTLLGILQYIKLAIELTYIVIAIVLERKHSKESREPRFLRLEAFIIPFIFGVLIRFYDSAMLALGIILTYSAVKLRDRYIDSDSGLYNGEYLEYLRKYRKGLGESKEYGLSVEAKGHGKEMASLLKELLPAGVSVFSLGDDTFYLISETSKKSAMKMTAMMIEDSVESSDAPYDVQILEKQVSF